MRSSSFRQSLTSPLPTTPGKAPSFDPEEDTAPEIYRKQAARIEELERENKRLAREASDVEKRWKKAEEELEDLREADGNRSEMEAGSQTLGDSANELQKLVSTINISSKIFINKFGLAGRACCSSTAKYTTSSASVPDRPTWFLTVRINSSK